MSRRRRIGSREILPDPKYNSELIAKFINQLMLDGKKSIAEKIIYSAIEQAKDIILKKGEVIDADEEDEGKAGGAAGKGGRSNVPQEILVFKKALSNLYPTVEVRSRRVGGATYQVPIEVRPVRRKTLAMRWLIQVARSRHEKGMASRLAAEIVDAFAGRGNAIKIKENVIKMAKANMAFAFYNW